jgi:hypothetical protein
LYIKTMLITLLNRKSANFTPITEISYLMFIKSIEDILTTFRQTFS